MSLQVDSHSRRSRSKSPGRERERSRSRVDDERDRSRVAVERTERIERVSSPPRSRYDDSDDSDRSYRYEEETKRATRVVTTEPRYSSSQHHSTSPLPGSYPTEPSSYKQEEFVQTRYGDRREKEYYNESSKSRRAPSPERSRYSDTHKYAEIDHRTRDDSRRYEEISEKTRNMAINLPGGIKVAGGISVGRSKPQFDRPESPTFLEKVMKKEEDPLAYGRTYEVPKKYEYAKLEEKITYSARPVETSKTISFEQDSRSRNPTKYRVDKSEVVTVEPGRSRHESSASLGYGSSLTVGSRGARERDPSPRPHSLSVSSTHASSLSLSAAPGSPLLESYHGTYQSISPMPSPMLLATSPYGEVEPLSPLSSDNEGSSIAKKQRHARFHDPRDDAEILAKALKGEKRRPDVDPLIEILPALTHKQMIDLRGEYKKVVKTGPEKNGVNIAKHLKMRLKEEDPALMKACYACALGQWQSEAYWANFWYHGEKSNRELLIESLMGRTNAEIRAIKDGFSDKKYSDSLVKCMKTELKQDKFKVAVLLVLDEKRMEDYGPDRIDRRLVEDDVHGLHKALRSEKGGESAIIQIIVLRSDSHLRECLRLYEATYRTNFAKEMLKKSGNLVGETLAHILNGVINRPVRDALLLHQALTLSSGRHEKNMRTELLISRLVRYHWDRFHMEAVKKEYKTRYNVELLTAVRDGTKGDWGRFCEQLCLRRMPDEVREVRRVAY